MQLPSIDRTPNVRPAGADLVSTGASKVIPVAPVNPSVHVSPPLAANPGVVDLVNPALKTSEGEPFLASVPDPTKSTPESIAPPKDWTIHRPAPVKVEDPPPKPISQILMDHLTRVWTASASAIQVEQVKELVTPAPPATPSQAPGELAKQVLTYQPSKIKKTENI